MITAPALGGSQDFRTLADDIGHARTIRILGISKRTFSRYYSENGHVPMVVCKALYWESNWGRSQVACDHYNERQIWFTRIRMLERQNERLREALKQLEGIVTGAANAPYYDEANELSKA